MRQLANAAGIVTLARSYEPFGSALSTVGPANTTYGFAGEQRDDSTGLTFLRARYLSSSTGRFLSKDAWGGDLRLPATQNGWAYANADPVNFTDPSGHGNPPPFDPSQEEYERCLRWGFDAATCEKQRQEWSKYRLGVGWVVSDIFEAGCVITNFPNNPDCANSYNRWLQQPYISRVADVVKVTVMAGLFAMSRECLSDGLEDGLLPNNHRLPYESPRMTAAGSSPYEELPMPERYRGIYGADLEEVIARAGPDWTGRPMDNAKWFEEHLKLASPDGIWEVRVHTRTLNPDVIAGNPGAPGVLGTIMRIGQRVAPPGPLTEFVDSYGFTYYDSNMNNVPVQSDAGHIPLAGNPYLETHPTYP